MISQEKKFLIINCIALFLKKTLVTNCRSLLQKKNRKRPSLLHMEETSAEISRAYNSPSGNSISPLHLKSADGKLFGSSIFPYKALKACAAARICGTLNLQTF